jgi:hypothetical protein
MPLRSLNETETILQALTAMQTVMLANTRVQQAGGTIFLNDATALYAMTATWPSMVLSEKPQSTARIAYRTYQTKLEVLAAYYDRWDEQTASLAQIWAAVDLDLRRMKANLEDNPALILNGIRGCEGIVDVALSPYEGQALGKTDGPFPVPVVVRTALIHINGLPYIGAH